MYDAKMSSCSRRMTRYFVKTKFGKETSANDSISPAEGDKPSTLAIGKC